MSLLASGGRPHLITGEMEMMTPPKIPRLQVTIWEVVTLEKALREYLPWVDEREWALELLNKLHGCEALHFTMRRDRSKKPKPVAIVSTEN